MSDLEFYNELSKGEISNEQVAALMDLYHKVERIEKNQTYIRHVLGNVVESDGTLRMEVEFQVIQEDPSSTMLAGIMALTRVNLTAMQLSSEQRLAVLETAAKLYAVSIHKDED